jgi:hypothetical protein
MAPPSHEYSRRIFLCVSQRYSAKVASKEVLPEPLTPMISRAVKMRRTFSSEGDVVGE